MVAVRVARLFDGERVSALTRPAVLVEGDRVVDVVEGSRMVADELIDLGDVTLLPGLIDAHVHLVFDASDDPVAALAAMDDEALLDHARAAASRALSAGITTMRDLGDRGYVLLGLRGALAADPTAGPELLVSGPPITTPGGHCWFLGGEAAGVDGVRAAVRQRAAHGVDVVKVMVTGGRLTAGSVAHESQYGRAELAAIAEEAHAHGLAVTGHAHGVQGIVDAVAAGFDGIEHCTWLTAHGVAADPAVIAAMAEAGTFVSVTAAANQELDIATRGTPFAKLIPQMTANVAAMIAAGVRVVVSSDAGIAPYCPHDALPYGVARLSLVGITGAAALRVVTAQAASACGVGNRKGRIAPGYDADLLAVAGNPFNTPAHLHHVAAVFRAGQRVR